MLVKPGSEEVVGLSAKKTDRAHGLTYSSCCSAIFRGTVCIGCGKFVVYLLEAAV